MFEELSFYLNQTVAPEHGDILIRALKVLERSGVTSVGDYLEEFMSTMNLRSTSETILRLETLLITQYEQRLNQFGIHLTEGELKLKVLTEMLLGVNVIEEYDNPISILDICHSDQDPEEKLVEMLSLTTSLGWADYLLVIESVNPTLITKIESVLPEAEVSDEVPPTQQYILTRMKKYLTDNANPWVLDEVNNGMMIGLPLMHYVDAFNRQLASQPVIRGRTNYVNIATQLIGYAFLSNLGDAEIHPELADSLELIYADTVEQTYLADALSKVFSVNVNN